jgi:hypothetical protein
MIPDALTYRRAFVVLGLAAALMAFAAEPTLGQSRDRHAVLAYLQFRVGTRMVERCSARFPEFRTLGASVLEAWTQKNRAAIDLGRELSRRAAERGEENVDGVVERRYQATIAEFAQKPEKDAWANCEAALQEFESTD